MGNSLYVVVGGQYGSEAKGAVAGRICRDLSAGGGHVIGVRVGGPNAGHTVWGACPPQCTENNGAAHEVGKHPWRLRQVPVAAVTAPDALLVIAAGSEVDPDVLAAELRELNSAGYQVNQRLIVDGAATALSPRHIAEETHRGMSQRIGSTAKGIGSARADRIWREAQTWGQYIQHQGRPDLEDVRIGHDTGRMLTDALRDRNGCTVVIEGTQGYGLGLHTDNYPRVTSGDCRAVDFLAQAGVSPWQADAAGWGIGLKVVVALRPYPIRVAGDSGDMLEETTWEALGLPEERTTVTNKVRRVGAWDPDLAHAAYRANGGPRQGVVWVALTMWDTVVPELAGRDTEVDHWASDRHDFDPEKLHDSLRPYLADIGVGIQHLAYVGTGPDTALVNRRLYD